MGVWCGRMGGDVFCGEADGSEKLNFVWIFGLVFKIFSTFAAFLNRSGLIRRMGEPSGAVSMNPKEVIMAVSS